LITNANRFIEICIGQNFFKEDESGQIIGLKNPLIEIYNSNTWPIYFHFEEYECCCAWLRGGVLVFRVYIKDEK
jgi:hypothetical protein